MKDYSDYQPYDLSFIETIEEVIEENKYDIIRRPLNQTQQRFTASLSPDRNSILFAYQCSLVEEGEAFWKLHYCSNNEYSWGFIENIDSGKIKPVFKGENHTGKIIFNKVNMEI